MQIPLVDLEAQLESIADEVEAAIAETLRRNDYILGDGVRSFEGEFAEFCEVAHCVGVGSGTDALHLACRALDIGPGDEVIVPAFTFIATALGVSLTGATPVLVDVDPETALIRPELIEAAITPRTRAIIPVHMFGQCADMNAIRAIADAHDLRVIEDAAQAHGARYHGQRAGAMGDLGCFSFYPGKNLGAYGDGGAVTTGDADLAARLGVLRHLGAARKYEHREIGLNSRLDTLQARILSVKLRHLADWNEKRRDLATRYTRYLENVPHLRAPRVLDHSEHVFHLYVVRANARDAELQRLNDAGIGAGIHYPHAVHEHEAYQHLGYGPGSFPAAESFARTCLSLPMYPELDVQQLGRILRVLSAAQVSDRFEFEGGIAVPPRNATPGGETPEDGVPEDGIPEDRIPADGNESHRGRPASERPRSLEKP